MSLKNHKHNKNQWLEYLYIIPTTLNLGKKREPGRSLLMFTATILVKISEKKISVIRRENYLI